MSRFHKAYIISLIIGAAIGLMIASCAGPITEDSGSIVMYHDDERAVTCWVLYQRAISCLPDAQIEVTP